jgi:hypothetical protein
MTLESDQVKREVLAATALAYAPATDIPRERALAQVAISSLTAAYGETAFTTEQALEEICGHGNSPTRLATRGAWHGRDSRLRHLALRLCPAGKIMLFYLSHSQKRQKCFLRFLKLNLGLVQADS